MAVRADLLGQIDALFHEGPLGHLSDADLLRRFVAGGGDAERAFAALVERHGPTVLAACRRLLRDPAEVEDAFQATFLVLARKAGRVGRPERLASWLYGVAARTAKKARTTASRRLRHERARAATVAEAGRPAEDTFELRAALHEEIARLPEKYRAPVVLCHLEGMTRERASAQLQCPESTVGVRLMRARERLRAGLARRGYAVAAGLPAVDLGAGASAAVPASLVAATAAAGVAFRSGQIAAAGTVPPREATLARGVLRTMLIERTLLAAPAALLLGLAASGVGHLAARPQAPTAPTTAKARPTAPAASPWKVTLPGGPTVELIGVASGPGEKADAWWTPAGSHLADPPFDGMTANVGVGPGSRPRLFAIRVTDLLAPADLDVTWEVPGSVATGSGTLKAKGRPVAEGVRGAAFYLPEGLASATLRVGVASGPWGVVARSEGRGILGVGFMGNGVVFSRARAIEGRTVLAIAEDVRDKDVRIVAIDRAGVEHRPATNSFVSAGTARLHDVEFKLKPEEIREIQVQSRPYEWAEFHNIALDPAPAAPGP